ncbi:insulin receptor substrate 1 isoform X3 [Cimex lectularius]|uniref:Insulin receptor substrate 1 n=1 Tax=Cimex lectularius TaxID=79782 RepID=A0A8I6TI23_CIMLE|nr:insulin receptor substrate 1 isoform X3 [Cimex lectularius]
MLSKNTGTKALTGGDIVKEGYLKKFKARTMRKKYFVLRGDSAEDSARLEYYDSEKKFRSNCPPKRSITLKTCFNINKRSDTKQKYVIALYTRNDCFCVVLETEEEMVDWLKAMLELQIGEATPVGDPIRPNFEHVWQVTVCNKELGAKRGIVGLYRLCLTDQSLSLVGPISSEDRINSIEFSLQKIRRCGWVDNFFYMEVGQCTVTGAGNLWMTAEDPNIAENISTTILNACMKCPKKDSIQAKIRNHRMGQTNESSKPITLIQRWPTHTASSGSSGGGGSGGLGVNHQRTYSFPLSPIPPTRRASTGTRPTKYITSTSPQSSLTGVRGRADTMPSRARATSECNPHLPTPNRNFTSSQFMQHSSNNRCISYSPPVASSPVSPASAACSTDSAGSSLSMDGDAIDGQWEDTGRYCHSLTPDEPVILEENSDDYSPWPGIREDEKLNNYVHSEPMFNHSIDGYRKNATNTGKSNSPSQGSYLDSPCGSSPLDTGNYLPMSPAENRVNIFGRTTINHSRGSSLAEDGYVPMAPAASDDGYVDMDHGSNRNRSDRYQSGELSTGSSCSITSGTPSTDIRFSEYQLDKVSSYFPAEDDIPNNDRPVRAYSVGSRPTNNKNRSEIISANTCERTRAFSVGSKNVRPINTMRLSMINQQPLSSSHSSVEPCDDMMVLDFSKKHRFRFRKKLSSNERLSVPGGSVSTLSSTASSYSTAEGSYIDMSSPRISPSLAPSPPKMSRLASFLGKSPPKHSLQDILSINKASPPVSGYPSPSLGRVPETEPGYVEMTVGSDSSQGMTISKTTNKNNNQDDAYVNMKPGNGTVVPVIAKNTNKPRVETFPLMENVKNNTFTSSTSNVFGGRNKDDYLDMSLKRKIPLIEDNNNSKVIVDNSSPKNQPDDYVEMNLGSDSKPKPSTYSGEDESDYLNMSGTKDTKTSDSRYISQPITIQFSSKETSVSPIYSIAGRKHSTGTPPKVPSYLPLSSSPSSITSPYSTMTRSKQRPNQSREDSRESLLTPTPSGSTIFPFNLCSPVNSPENYESSPKCPVDGTSGTIRLSYGDNSHSENDLSTLHTRSESVGDYVNYDPRGLSNTDQEYTLMEPSRSSFSSSSPTAIPCRKTSAPSLGAAKLKPMEKLLSGLGNSFNSLSMSSSTAANPPSPINSESDTSTLVNESVSLVEEDIGKQGENSSRKSSLTGIGNKELHYASLDLMRSGSESEDSNRTLKTQTSLTESSSASSPSPNLTTDASAFNYAEIDFVKSGSSQKTIH